MSQLKQPVTEHDHHQGSLGAAAVLVEYGDYECPYCARAHRIVKAVQGRIGERILFVFRNFPLATIHPHAELAAESAESAGAQGRFWEMHDILFENQLQLGPDLIVAAAQELDLDVQRFMGDLGGRVYRERVQEDFLGGVRSGVNGTPSFFINGLRYDVPVEVDSLTAALELAARTSRASRPQPHGMPAGR